MNTQKQHLSSIDQFMTTYFEQRKSDFFAKNDEFKKIQSLFDAMEYSVFTGGKRFRPVLSLLVADVLGVDTKKVLPFAAAVEFIHTYSLIHDDLPCMDDDDLRRGKPSNHKKFGEDIALLAGDSLLTEAFYLIGKHYNLEAGPLTLLLTQAVGISGMIGGQVLDILKVEGEKSKELLDAVHELKTGALIRVAIEGAAICCKADVATQKNLREFGESLGFAFQLADDVDDFLEKGKENTNYVNILGLPSTRELLKVTTDNAIKQISSLGKATGPLVAMAEFNYNRVTPSPCD